MSLWKRIYDERKGVILPLALVIVANVAVLLLAIVPLQTIVAAAESDALNARLDLAEARRVDRQTTDARASKERADLELQKFYDGTLPHDYATAVKTTGQWLEQAAQDAGLDFQGSHFVFEDVKESHLSHASTKFTLQGKYANVRKFLYAVETAEEFIIIEKVELGEFATGQSGPSGTLVVTLAVSTYFVTPAGR